MMRINPEVIRKLKDSQIDISSGCLYLLSVYFGLSHSDIPESVKASVNRTKLIDRNYKNGGKPLVTLPLILREGHDKLFENAETHEEAIEKDKIFLQEWMDLWPKPQETGLLYSVSGNGPQCKSRMTSFLNSGWAAHDLPKKTREEKRKLILEATKRYIAYQKTRRWAYTKKNVKFINDMEGSVLAEWVLKVLKGEGGDTKTVLERMI